MFTNLARSACICARHQCLCPLLRVCLNKTTLPLHPDVRSFPPTSRSNSCFQAAAKKKATAAQQPLVTRLPLLVCALCVCDRVFVPATQPTSSPFSTACVACVGDARFWSCWKPSDRDPRGFTQRIIMKRHCTSVWPCVFCPSKTHHAQPRNTHAPPLPLLLALLLPLYATGTFSFLPQQATMIVYKDVISGDEVVSACFLPSSPFHSLHPPVQRACLCRPFVSLATRWWWWGWPVWVWCGSAARRRRGRRRPDRRRAGPGDDGCG